MDTASWYAKKLAEAAGRPAPPPPPPSPGLPGYVPPQGLVVPVNAPPGSPPQPTHLTPQPQSGFYSFTADGQMSADDGFIAQVYNAAASTGGTAFVKANSAQCPNCGGPNFFARNLNENGSMMRIPAAPQCFDCGHPNIQSSSTGGALAMAKPTATRQARQLKPGHEVKVVLEGGRVASFPAATRREAAR